MGNLDQGATDINFMALLQSIDCNKLERFSNVADKISAKILSSFLEYEVLVVIRDRYGLEFSIKGDERKHGTEYSPHIQEIEIIDCRKVSTSFQSYLFEQQKTTWWNRFSKNGDTHCHTF